MQREEGREEKREEKRREEWCLPEALSIALARVASRPLQLQQHTLLLHPPTRRNHAGDIECAAH